MESNDQISRDELLNSVSADVIRLVKAIGTETVPRCQIIPDMGLKGRRSWRIYHLNPAREAGYVVMAKPESPNSPSQMYRLTQKGLDLLAAIKKSEGK